MAQYSRQIEVPYSCQQMQELVSDVRAYPDFIPWLSALKLEREKTVNDVWEGRAKAVVGFKGFSETFVTDVESDGSQRSITVSLVKGPFSKLNNQWLFEAESPTSSTVLFEIEYEFSNPLLQMLAKANLSRAVSLIMQAFLNEAEKRYGSVHD